MNGKQITDFHFSEKEFLAEHINDREPSERVVDKSLTEWGPLLPKIWTEKSNHNNCFVGM